MVIAIGVDVVEIQRIAEFVARGERYISRVFSPGERALASDRGEAINFYAGRFVAKEAIGKCLGPPLPWQDVEILSAGNGKPRAVTHGAAARAAAGRSLHVSISHSRDYAVAVAILEAPEGALEDIG